MFASLFGKSKDPDPELLITGDAQVQQFLAESWGWLIGTMQPLHFTACGDVFLSDGQAVHWLETVLGKLTRLADSGPAFKAMLQEPTFRDEVLQAPLVRQLRHRLGPLQPGRCYSYKIMPVMGGSQDLENRVTLSLLEHVGLNGDIRIQIKDLPAGATVQFKVVD